MSNAMPIILRLLKHLSRCRRVFIALTTSVTSLAQGLRILVTYFRTFVTKICGSPGYNSDSKISAVQCGTVLTSNSSAQGIPLLPVHSRQTTSSAPAMMPPSIHQPNMPTPQIPFQSPKYSPFAPSDVASSRYDNRPFVDMSLQRRPLPKFTRDFPNQSCSWLTGSWKSYVHPEGALYLYNDSLRAFTEANIDENTFRKIDRCVKELYDGACKDPEGFKSNTGDVELVVQHEEDQAPYRYYFVDHKSRKIFWLENLNESTETIFQALNEVYDLSHIGHALEYEYWLHCYLYPNYKMDREKVLKELRELVMYASAEIIVSDTSLSPFDADELSKILELINHLKENTQDNDFLHSTCVIARFMHYFSRAKFFNFCGLPYARLDADKSVYPEVTDHLLPRSLYLVLDIMLFSAPRAHLKDLRRVWVDESIVMPRWKDFNRNLMAEWTGITIYSTVMLAVDVSLLTVPSMYVSQSQSMGVIATYLSTVFITGSLIISLLLARQNQEYGFESADRATEFLSDRTGFFGVKSLATVHSLPFAMLMWGMIFFAIALLYIVFKSARIAIQASVISGCGVVIIFISWFVWTGKIGQLVRR